MYILTCGDNTRFCNTSFCSVVVGEKYCVTAAVTFDTWCTFPVFWCPFFALNSQLFVKRNEKSGGRSLINSVNVIEKRKMRHSINLDFGVERLLFVPRNHKLTIFSPCLPEFEKSFHWLATWKSLTMSLRLKLELLQKTDCVLFIHSSLLDLLARQSKNCQEKILTFWTHRLLAPHSKVLSTFETVIQLPQDHKDETEGA